MSDLQVCSNKPVKECATVSKTVNKNLPDTTCERWESVRAWECEIVGMSEEWVWELAEWIGVCENKLVQKLESKWESGR